MVNRSWSIHGYAATIGSTFYIVQYRPDYKRHPYAWISRKLRRIPSSLREYQRAHRIACLQARQCRVIDMTMNAGFQQVNTQPAGCTCAAISQHIFLISCCLIQRAFYKAAMLAGAMFAALLVLLGCSRRTESHTGIGK